MLITKQIKLYANTILNKTQNFSYYRSSQHGVGLLPHFDYRETSKWVVSLLSSCLKSNVLIQVLILLRICKSLF